VVGGVPGTNRSPSRSKATSIPRSVGPNTDFASRMLLTFRGARRETQSRKVRPQDLTEERWILELADIYGNAFSEHASMWRDADARRMSDFYRFGTESPRHISSRASVLCVLAIPPSHRRVAGAERDLESTSLGQRAPEQSNKRKGPRKLGL
jgi:hypothetical protein